MHLKNEKGSTLLIVLLSLALISIFTTVVTTQVLSSSKQINQTETIQVATDVAEMGIDHFYQEVKKNVLALDVPNITCSQLQTTIASVTDPSLNTNYEVDDDTYYSISLNPSISCLTVSSTDSTSTTYEFSFFSTGIAKNNNGKEVEKRLTATFPIHVSSNNKPTFNDCSGSNCTTTGADGTIKLSDDAHFKSGLTLGNKTNLVAEKSIYVEGNASFSNFARALVKGDFYLTENFIGSNHSELYVEGNATFYNKFLNKPHAFICVDSTLNVTKDIYDKHYNTDNKTDKYIYNLSDKGFSSCADAKAYNDARNGHGTELKGIYSNNIASFNPNSNTNIAMNDHELEVIY